jgi:hypothetical protein
LASMSEIKDEDCRLVAASEEIQGGKANAKSQEGLALAPGVEPDDHGQANNKKTGGLALAPGVEPDDHGQANNKKAGVLTLAPGVEPDDHGQANNKKAGGLALAPGIAPDYHCRGGLAEEEKSEIMIPTYPNHRSAPRVDEEESLLDDDSCVFPGAFRMGGNDDDDDDDATYQTEPVDLHLTPPAASSADVLLVQGELALGLDEEIAAAVLGERERIIRESDQNAEYATNVRVIKEDGVATPTQRLSRGWKLEIAIFVLLLFIGTVVTVSIVFSRKRSSSADLPTNGPTAPPTMSRFSIMEDVIGSSFEDDFPSSTLQEQALNWLADQDPAYLAVDTNSSMLLERYTAVHFYFAMKGSMWMDNIGWLSENPICLWKGLNCTDDGFLAMINLGTCLLASFCL